MVVDKAPMKTVRTLTPAFVAVHVAFRLGKQHTAAQLQLDTAWVLACHLEFDHIAFLQHA